MEVLAKANKAMSDGLEEFEDDSFGPTPVSIPLDELFEKSYNLYKDTAKKPLEEKDKRECLRWVNKLFTICNGMYDPRKFKKILGVEPFFDFEIDRPWADYQYELPDGRILKGKLALKGSIDLIVEHDNGAIEVIDYKTGKMWDWGTNKAKTQEDLERDHQLRMYHLAVSKLFPNAKEIIITIIYINFGAYSMTFHKADLEHTDRMLEKKFNEIKNTTVPKRSISFKCSKFCGQGTNQYPGTKMTYCDYFHKEINTKGMNRVLEEYLDADKLGDYGAGGGQENKSEKT